jgi:predicted MFS family arabinose efflux permease
MLGPVIGSLIYSSLGYMYTFFVFGVILSVGCIFVIIALPSSLNRIIPDCGNDYQN